MEQKKYITYGAVAVVIFALGIATGSFFVGREARPAGSANTFQAGWDAAKKRLSETGYAFPVMAEAMSVSGIVQDIKDDGMTVAIRPLEPLADPALDIRTVKFDANTKLYQIDQKDPIKYQKEVEAFNLKMRSVSPQTIPANYPQSFVKTAITAKDIKIGMNVTITAANNIKESKEFIATEITVQTVTAPIAPTSVITPVVTPR